MQDEIGLVLHVPEDLFAFFEVHGLGNGGGEVDVILVGGFLTLDALHFGRVSHDVLLSCLRSSIYARAKNTPKNHQTQEENSKTPLKN